MISCNKWLLLALCASCVGCTVTIGDDPDISRGGSAGQRNGGSGGQSNAGSGGQSDGGSGGNAAGGSAGSAGSSMDGAQMGEELGTDAGIDAGNSVMFATPSCSADTSDNACTQCLKQKCCTAWLACDTAECVEEYEAVVSCVEATTDLDMTSYSECVSSSLNMSLALPGTLGVLDCINEDELADAGTDDLTRCGPVCFGQDYLP